MTLPIVTACFLLFIGISNLTLEDSDALTAVLPVGHATDSQYSFYLFAADLFRNTYIHYGVVFSQLALQCAPPGTDTGSVWSDVVKGLMDLGSYEDAYATIMSMPFAKQLVFL